MPPAATVVKISSLLPYLRPAFDLPAQFPDAAPGDPPVRFAWNEPVESCAAWIVLDGLEAPDTTACPPENVVLLTAEPASPSFVVNDVKVPSR